MSNRKRSLTAIVIGTFLVFSVVSSVIFTVHIQKSGKEESIKYNRENLLEITREKSDQISVTFERIESKAELVGIYMEEALKEKEPPVLSDEYTVDENRTLTRKRDIEKNKNVQSNVIVPDVKEISPELIYEINVTERLDKYFEEIIQSEEISWCYIVTRSNLLRCSPYNELNKFFSDNHNQINDVFYVQANEENNPERKAIWTDLYNDYLGTGWTRTCSKPVYDENGELFGVVCLDFSVERMIDEYFSGFPLGETGKLCWISGEGDIYYHTDYGSIGAGHGETLAKNIYDIEKSEKRKNLISEILIANDSGIVSFDDEYGGKMFVYSPVSGTDSLLLMEIDEDEFGAFLSVDINGVAIVLLVNLLLAILFAIIMHQKFSQPMRKLVRQAEEISKSNYSLACFGENEDDPQEIASLRKALRTMSEDIVEYTEGIVDKNREITAILDTIEETLMVFDSEGNVELKSKNEIALPKKYIVKALEKLKETHKSYSEQLILKGQAYKAKYYPIVKSGSVERVVISCECITKSWLLEKELQQIEKMAGVGQLAAALAHELKNLLARITGAVYIIKMTERGNSREIISIEKNVREAEELITTLLDFSKPGNKDVETVNIVTLINQILLLSQKEIIGKGITVDKDGMKECHADTDGREALKVILQNLIINGIQAVEVGGRIKITCENENDSAIVRIRDWGSGISAEPKEKIFEPFFTTKETGTGIGLWIVKRLTERLGGKIHISEETETGTEFVLTIPVNKKEVPEK